MKAFTFDLQRFATAACKIERGGKIYVYGSLSDAYDAAKDGDTITLTGDGTENGFRNKPISKNITFDLDGYTLTVDDGAQGNNNRAFTSTTGANYTFKNGIILATRGNINNVIINSGTLTLEGINLASNKKSGVINSGNNAVTSIKEGIKDDKKIDSSVLAWAGKYTLDNGIDITSVGTSENTSPTIRTQSDGSATVSVSRNKSNFTASEPGSKEVTYTANTNLGLTVVYDSGGNPSIQNLASGLAFTVNSSSGTSSIKYTVTDGGIQATDGNIIKVLQGVTVNPDTPLEMTLLEFDNNKDYMKPAIFATNDVLTVSASDLDLLNAGEVLQIVDNSNYLRNYGTLTKINDTTFALKKTDATLSSIVINDALTAQISSAFRNVPITVVGGNVRQSTSLVSGTNADFTLSSSLTSNSNALVSVEGAVNVSLLGGSIKTANSQTTIRAGANGRTIQYTANAGDGVNVIVPTGNTTIGTTNSTVNNGNLIIGSSVVAITDIDEGESFKAGDNEYYRDSAGLRTGATGAFTGEIATIYSSSEKSDMIAVDLASLQSSVVSFAQPENGVLEIGKNNIGNMVVVNDKNDPTIKYAELLSSVAGNYNLTLTSDSNAESFRNAVDTISLAGGTAATINKNFVNGSSKTVTIAAGAGTSPDTTFKVTNVTGDTFSVNLKTSSAETKISDVTGITLLSGTINAQAGQIITLGDGGRTFRVSSSTSKGMNVTFDNGTATITGNVGDTFVIDYGSNEVKTFKVDKGTMTFTVTAEGITVNDLETATNDAFTYNGATYNVYDAGFIRTEGTSDSIWTEKNDSKYHSLRGSSVDVADLATGGNKFLWNPIAPVSLVNGSLDAATLPPSATSTKVTLVSNDYRKAYGIFTKDGTNCTLETGSSVNESKLKGIFLNSGIVNDFYFAPGLDSIAVSVGTGTKQTAFMVTEDGDDGYEVTLTGSGTDDDVAAKLGGISRVSLITGTLESDSSFTTNVLSKGIVASVTPVTLITDGSEASITGVGLNEQFSIEGSDGNFFMSEVGLVNGSRYLLGTKEGSPILFSQLDDKNRWGTLINVDEITLTAETPTALIVNDTSSPTLFYADYTKVDDTRSLDVSKNVNQSVIAEGWIDSVTICVSDTTVSFSDYFKDKNIRGEYSGAEFTVEDYLPKGFTVQDIRESIGSHAVIGRATNISQTAGTISVTGGQVIHSDAGSITAATGNSFTFTVEDDAATIAALDNNDVFSLESSGINNVEFTKNPLGIVTGDNRILTGLAVNESVTVDQLRQSDNWTNSVQINKSNILNVPPSVSSGLASPWIILSNDKTEAYGTLETLSSGGYSVHRSDNAISSRETVWSSANTFRVNNSSVTFTADYGGANIAGVNSRASISATEPTSDFTFIDGAKAGDGATIDGTGADKINQYAGLVVPWVGQTIVAGNHTIAPTVVDGEFNVSVAGSNAFVTELSQGDEFKIDDFTFKVLPDGVIQRNSTAYGLEINQITGTTATADSLTAVWGSFVEVEENWDYVIDTALVSGLTVDKKTYIVVKDNREKVYGTITKKSEGYTVTTEGATIEKTFPSATIAKEIASVKFDDSYFIRNSTSITAGGATFVVTAANDSAFTVEYDYTTNNAHINNATAVNLTSGTIDLKDAAQTVTAGSNTAALVAADDAAVGTVSLNYDGTKLTVGMDAGDSVTVNSRTYTCLSGNGMTIEVAGKDVTFKNLDTDSFEIDGVTYTISPTGFVRKTGENDLSMWTGTALGESGITFEQLTNEKDNWTPIAVVAADRKLRLDGTEDNYKKTVVLVGDENNPLKDIYGLLEVGTTRTLKTSDNRFVKTADLDSITVDGVTVTITEDFSSVPIIPLNNASINVSAPMKFEPEVGTPFNVVSSGKTYTYTLASGEGSTYVLTTAEGFSLTQLNSKSYTLPDDGTADWRVHEGTVDIPEFARAVTVTDGTKISIADGDTTSISATAANGAWTSLSRLTAGDKFTITDTSSNANTYAVLKGGNILGKYDAEGKEITQFLDPQISDARLDYSTITDSDNYYPVMSVDDEGVLDLKARPSRDLSNIKVYGKTDGVLDPTKEIAYLAYDATNDAYTLSNLGATGELNLILLDNVNTLTLTNIYKPVTTAANDTGTYTINGTEFTADNSALTLTPSANGVTLTGGKVKLTAGKSVLTTSGTITADSTNSGEITVEVGNDITVGGLQSGAFEWNDGSSTTKYTVSPIGLSYYTSSNEEKLFGLGTPPTITVSQLQQGGETILDATGGKLEIQSTTPELAAVVDKNSGTRYGTLTKKGTTYEFTAGNAQLGEIKLNGVAATLPQATGAQITSATSSGTVTAVFTVTASGDFSVDATKNPPEFGNTVTDINLESGTVNALNVDGTGINIGAGGRTITATNDSSDKMTVSYDGTNTVIGGLNIGDKFKINGIAYEVLSSNELYNTDNKQLVKSGFDANAKTYTVGDNESYNLITLGKSADSLTYGDTLNLTVTVPNNALIVREVDGAADPTKKIATLTYNATTNTFALSDAGDNVGDLEYITLPANDTTLNTGTINVTVNTTRGSSTYNINGNTFKARSELTVETTGASTATLTSGTVTLNKNDKVTPTDGKEITATAGTVTVKVDGSTVTVGSLGNGDSFTYDGETYTKTNLGLSYDSKLLEDIDSSVRIDQLSGGKTILEAPSGVLTINPDALPTGTTEWTVVDTSASTAVKYGRLTFDGSIYTFTQDQDGSALSSVALVGNITASLPATVGDGNKTITAGGATFAATATTASDAFTVKATSSPITLDGVSAVTLSSGTINAPSVPVKAGDYTIERTGGDGMTVKVDGSTVSLGGLNSGDEFKIDGKYYVYNSAGLFNISDTDTDSKRVRGVSNDGTLALPASASEIQILAPSSKHILNLTNVTLTNVTDKAEVYDSTTNPTTKLADVKTSSNGLTLDGTAANVAKNITTVDIANGSNWTIDFATDVRATRATVNRQYYNGTGALTISSDGTNSTLKDGTVTLNNSDVPTAQGTIAATTGTITVNVKDGAVTLGAIGTGDAFNFTSGSTTASYKKVSFGLVSGGKLRTLEGSSLTVDDLNTSSSDWQNMIGASNGNLELDASKNAGIVVDSTAEPSALYGTLSKSEGNTFTLEGGNDTLSGVTLTDVIANLPANLSGKSITANGNNVFTVTATEEFEINADDSIPIVSGVSAVRLTRGSVATGVSVTVTPVGVTVTATGDSGDKMTVGLVGGYAQVGGLDVGDTFTVATSTGTTRYKVTASGLQDLYNGKVIEDGEVYSASAKTFTIGLSDGAYELITPNSSGELVLSTLAAADGDRYRVVKDESDPNTQIGTLIYSSISGFYLDGKNDGEYVDALSSIRLGNDKPTLTTTIDTTVNTESGNTAYVINGNYFAASGSALSITAANTTDATLKGGTVTIEGGANNASVATAQGTVGATDGDFTVVAGDSVTIRGIDSGEVFTFGGKNYTRTDIGLSDGSKLIAGNIASVTAEQLDTLGSAMLAATDGNFIISNRTGTEWIVVDSLSAPAKNYGKLSKDADGYTFEDGDDTLSGINISGGLNATLTTAATVTAGGASFTAGGNFIVNANTPPTIADATGITLSSGTINAPENVSVTAGDDYVIERTGGDGMTITRAGDNVSIGGLNISDTFTVNGKSYKMTAIGLINTTSADSPKRVKEASNGTWNLSDTNEVDILTTDGDTLNLTNVTLTNVTDGPEVYDSTLTTKLAKVSTTDGGLRLDGTAANVEKSITTVTLAPGSDWTIKFATNAETTRGTVNGQSYASTDGSTLTIRSDGTGSTLSKGTVTLNENNSVTPTGGKTITATANAITVTVTDKNDSGTIGLLEDGDQFTYDGATYIKTNLGLRYDSKLLTVTNNSIDVDDLKGGSTIIAATDGNFTISNRTGTEWIAVDSVDAPTINYGKLSKDADGSYTFEDGDETLSGITVNNGLKAKLTTAAPVTAGSATFTAEGNFTVESATVPTISGASSITLESGTINAPENVSVTAGDDYVIERTGGDGMTITRAGDNVSIGGLNIDDTFTVNGKSYEMTAIGLINTTSANSPKRVEEASGTWDLSKTGEIDILAPSSEHILNLTNVTDRAEVYDDTSNPTLKLAKVSTDGGLTIDDTDSTAANLITQINIAPGSDWTVGFVTDVTTTRGTVNRQYYNGTGTLTIHSDGTNSTLTSGTVRLATDDSVPTAQGTITATNGTINVTADADAVTVKNLASGKAFKVDDETYTATAIGLTNADNQWHSLDNNNTAADIDALSSGWLNMIAASDGTFTIDTATASGIVVNSLESPTRNYGTITKTSTGYTFTDGDHKLDGITVANDINATLTTSVPVTAGDATFTAEGTFTVKSATVPTIEGATSITVIANLINAPTDIPVNVGTHTVTAKEGGDGVTVGLNADKKVVVSGLSAGDTFIVDDTTEYQIEYQMNANGELYDITNGRFVTDGFEGDTFIVDQAGFGTFEELDENDNLDLRSRPAAAYTAFVVAKGDNSKRVATLVYDGTGYALNTRGAYFSELNHVLLNVVTTFDTALPVTVKTASSGTYHINEKDFTARTELLINADSSGATLAEGTVALSSGKDVVTAGGKTITATAGTVTVTVSGSDVTIGELAAGDQFTVDDNAYLMTSIGISDGNRILPIDNADVTLDELNQPDGWRAILNAPSGALSVDNDTPPLSAVVDISNPSSVVEYGTLRKDGTNYTYTHGGNQDLQSITLDGVALTLPQTCAGATFAAGDSTFSVTVSGDTFTVDDTGSVPAVFDADSIMLTAGSVQPELDITVNVGSRKITATSGIIQVVRGQAVSVAGLNPGDAFTVDKKAYRVTEAGELFAVTDSSIVTSGFSGDTFTIDDAALTRIITADGNNLDLTNETQSALVYDDATNPNTLLATLSVTGSKYTLAETDDNIIRSVDIKAGSELDIDFAATVNASGSVVVNDVTYNGKGDLIIYSDETTSRLYGGTITLTPAAAAPYAVNDSATLAVNAGEIDATAENGRYTTLSNLDAGDQFTYNGTTYTQSKYGLLQGGNICESLAGSTLNLSALDTAVWNEFLAPDSNKILDLTSASVNAAVFDDFTNPTKKVADLNIINGRKILKGASGASKAIQTVLLNSGDNLTVDFATQVSAGSATVNGTTYNGTTDLLIDAKANSSSLYSGTVTIDAGKSVKATNDSVALGVNSGSVNANATLGTFVALNDVDSGDSFTFKGNTYTQTNLGLLSGDTIAQDLTGSFVDLTTLADAQWLTFIAPRNGTLDISSITSNKIVFDSTSAPVNKLADLTFDGNSFTLTGTRHASDIDTVKLAKDASLTIDFAAQVEAPAGNPVVNGVSFRATSAVTLDATDTSATLAKGSVALDNGQSVTTSSGYNLSANAGDGLTVTANSSSISVGNLNSGDDFSLDGVDYSLRPVGLLRGELIYLHSAGVLSSGNVSVGALTSDDWRQAIFIDGALNLPTEPAAGFLLDDDLTKLYGYLTASNRNCTLTAPSNVNAALDAIRLDGFSLTADAAFASVPLRAGSSLFSHVSLLSGATNFTLDATALPTFSNVKSFTLLAGSVIAKSAQYVTAGGHIISGNALVALDGDGVVISDFTADFTLDGDTYHAAPVGLINLTDSAIVTNGYTAGTLTANDIALTPFVGVSNGTIDLTRADSNVLIYDSATDPDKQIASLTVEGNKFTLNGTDDAALIQNVNVAAGSDLTVDFAAQVSAPSGTVTINGKTYNATTAVTLQSDGTTSTLSTGTVALANGGSVETTAGNTIVATAGDGLTVTASSDTVTINGLNKGDTFTVEGKTYTVGALSLISEGKLWTGGAYNGTTTAALADDANWTNMLSATYSSVAVDGATLEDGGAAVLVDNTTDPTTTYGKLTKTDGIYLLMKDDTADDKLAAISVQGTIIDIDVELADVPITTINADHSQSVFTVKPSAGVETFRVDATGNSTKIYGVDEIDLISGKVFPLPGQIVIPADPTQPITLSYGNGTYTIGDKTITIGGLADNETVDIEINGDGNINSVYSMPKDAYVIYADVTYTAPFDDARLSFEEEPCYFEGYTLPAYSVVIDPDGNVKVDTGIRLGNVVQSGKTIGDDGTIQIAGDGSPVKITNESDIPLKVTDTNGDTLAENLNADEGVTFSDDGVSAEDLTAVAGATVYLDDGQALTAEGEATVAAQGDATVGVNEDSTGMSVDGSAVIDAPADTELTLGNAPYTVKGADFESSGTAQATVTSNGVKLDLGISDAITHDDMTLTGGENSTAELNGDGGITLTSGAIAENATDKAITVDGTVQLDDKTVNSAEAVEVTAKADGLNVGDTELTLTGDNNGYQVNIEDGAITGLENVGNGATVGGLSDATIKTNQAGSLTVGDKTFTTTGDSSVTYGLDNGSITSVSDLNGIIAGDFSEVVTVNGDPLEVDSSLKSEVAIAAGESGVTAVQTGDADAYTINGHAFETSGDALFGMSSGRVTGVTTDDGIFAIGQNETDFAVNGETLTLNRNTKPVRLSVDGGAISEVRGVDGLIGGLNNATVYDLAKATVNGKVFDVNGTTFNAIVAEGIAVSITGLKAPATINSAPSVAIVTSTDGSYTVGSQGYTLNDTLDNSVTFTTDANSNLTGIKDFAGSLNGAVTSLTLNGKAFGTNNSAVTVSSDGHNITAIDGLKNGDSIGGDIENATFFMPQGRLTINGGVYTLEDDEDGATSRGGKTFTGVAKDASLTVGAEGTHRVNGSSGRASTGSVFTVNRDGGYMINPDYLPIIEKTPASDIRARSDGTLAMQETNGTVGAGNDTVVVRRDAQVTADASGEPLIIATSGSVTLENYSMSASVGSFEYTNIANAIKSNAIQFGDGVMTLGDAVITFNANAGSRGATQAQLVNAQGKEQAIGFTHTAGGTITASSAGTVLKGNYADKPNDTQKSGGSNLTGGAGNDTLLIGAGDTADGGAGNDQIYVTDGAFRESGAQIIMSAGSDTVHNFKGGYGSSSDTIRIGNLNALEYEATAGLVLKSGDRSLTFDGFGTSSADLVTDMAESADAVTASDGSYRLKLRDANGTYNAAIARAGKNIYVADGDGANVFMGTNSGVNFSEFTGAVAVNLDTGTGNVGSQSAQFKGINQLTGGAGFSTLTGAADVSNTLKSGLGGGQIRSNSGNDLMIGQSGKTSATTFQYLANDGQDTVSNFEFATSADAAGDLIDITTANEVTTVSLSGGDVILYINGSETDYLTLAQGKGNDFRINNLVAQVDERHLDFDGLANCYVADSANATLQVDSSVEAAQVWLNDMGNGLHGTYYLGDITVVDGSKSAGQLILTGNDLDNTVTGGAGTNSIWGGYGYDSDVMIGGNGQNTFFFGLVNGNDVIQGAHDGDVIDLTTIKTSDIVGTQITEGTAAVGLWDGSVLEVRSNAAVEYKTADGTYIADHASGQWVKKG